MMLGQHLITRIDPLILDCKLSCAFFAEYFEDGFSLLSKLLPGAQLGAPVLQEQVHSAPNCQAAVKQEDFSGYTHQPQS